MKQKPTDIEIRTDRRALSSFTSRLTPKQKYTEIKRHRQKHRNINKYLATDPATRQNKYEQMELNWKESISHNITQVILIQNVKDLSIYHL